MNQAMSVFGEVTANVLEVLKPEALERWWETEMRELQGLTPFEAWSARRYDDILALSRSYLDPSFT